MGGEPLMASAPKRPSRVGPDMSLRSALGVFQAINGSRGNANGEISRDFIADRIFCWRRARVRSDSRLVAVVVAGAGKGKGLLAVDVGLALLQAQRVATVLEAAVDLGDDAAALVGDAAHGVDQLREVVEVDLDQVVDLDAEVLLDRLDGERRAAERVGGVDLVGAVAGDVDDRVARDREPRVLAAADAHQQDRVRAAAVGRRAGLLGVLGPRVGAEHEDRVGAGQREAGAAEGDLAAEVALLELGADQEEHEREGDPAERGEDEPLDDAPD